MTATVNLWVALAVIVIVGAGLTGFAAHERAVEKQKIEQAETQAKNEADKASEQKIAAAQQEAKDAQGRLDAYVAQYPIGDIVCYENRYVLPTTTAAKGNAGPAAGGQVPAGSPAPSPDIGPAIDAIVRGFGQVVVDYNELAAER